MNIRFSLLALVAVSSMNCALSDNPTPSTDTEDQGLSAACGPVCAPIPDTFQAAGIGADCTAAYANAVAGSSIPANGSCVSEGYTHACGVVGTPLWCYWSPSFNAYYGLVQISQGCRDTTC